MIKQRSFSAGQTYVALSCSTSLSKLNILSDFDPKIIKPNHLALKHSNIWEKKRFYLHKGFHWKTISFTFKYTWISKNYFGFYWWLKAFACTSYFFNRVTLLSLLLLLPSSNLSGITTTYQIIRNDDEIEKIKSIAALYDENTFTCLEQENYNAVLYIKFVTTLISLNQFSMLAL